MSGTAVRRTVRLQSGGGRVKLDWAVVAVLALAFAVRLAVVLSEPHYAPRTDAADFDRIAVSLVRFHTFPHSVLDFHGGPTAFRPPLFPFLLGAVYKVVGLGASTRWQAGLVLQAVLGTLIVAFIYLIAGRLWNRRLALVAGLIAALYPPLWLVGSSLLSEPLFIVLELASVLAALIHRDSAHRWRWVIASGVLLGLAGLARSNGVGLVIPIAFLVWTERPRLSRWALRAPAVLVVALVLTLTPWTIRNAEVFHAFVPISNELGYGLVGTYNLQSQEIRAYPATWLPPVWPIAYALSQHPHANEAQLNSELTRAGLKYAAEHPAYVARVFYWNTLRLFDLTGTRIELWSGGYEAYPRWLISLSVYSFWAFAPFAVLGFALGAYRRVPWAVWGCPLVIFLSTVFFLGATRYRSPADPFLIMAAAFVPCELWRRWGGGRSGERSLPSLAG